MASGEGDHRLCPCRSVLEPEMFMLGQARAKSPVDNSACGPGDHSCGACRPAQQLSRRVMGWLPYRSCCVQSAPSEFTDPTGRQGHLAPYKHHRFPLCLAPSLLGFPKCLYRDGRVGVAVRWQTTLKGHSSALHKFSELCPGEQRKAATKQEEGLASQPLCTARRKRTEQPPHTPEKRWDKERPQGMSAHFLHAF